MRIDLSVRPNRDRLAQFFSKLIVSAAGCWEWQAATTHGYAAFNGHHGGRTAYRWFVGPIPDGYEVDHLCRNRACVNPAHLEAVTHQENNRRRSEAWLAEGKCKRGHALTAENIGRQRNGRTLVNVCIACLRTGRQREDGRAGQRALADAIAAQHPDRPVVTTPEFFAGFCRNGHQLDDNSMVKQRLSGRFVFICLECELVRRARVNRLSKAS